LHNFLPSSPLSPYLACVDHPGPLLCRCDAADKLLHQTVGFQSPKLLRGSVYALLHVISWPYLDIVSAFTVGGHLLSLVRHCSTLCQMIYEILQSAQQFCAVI